jgi:membrane protein DedA with SNARE-associated domain
VDIEALLTGVSPAVVYVLVGLVISLESMGIPLPGEVILVSSALLASRHALDVSPVWVAAAATCGAILGDSLGYLAGRRWGVRLFQMLGRRFPRHAGPDQLGYAGHMFTRYGVWAVFFGRFVALLRIFAGPLAGALRMSYRRFLTANALGGLVWACGTTAAVHTLGTVAEQWLKRSSWIALVVAAGVAIVVSRVLGRRIERAVARYARERDSGPFSPQKAPADSQEAPPDGPGSELVA